MNRQLVVTPATPVLAAGSQTTRPTRLAYVDRAVKVLVITFDDFINPASRPNDRVEQLAIVGSTGRHPGACGIVDIELLPNFRSRWIISTD